MRRAQGFDLLKLAAISFVIIGITLTIGQDIMSNLSSDYTADTYEANATVDTQAGLAEVSSWFETIGLVIAAAVVLGVVGMFIARRM